MNSTNKIKLTKLQKTQISLVIGKIDFEKIFNVIRYLEWPLYTTKEDLIDKAVDVLSKASVGGYCSCGGFTSTYNKGDFRLSFEISEGSSFVD